MSENAVAADPLTEVLEREKQVSEEVRDDLRRQLFEAAVCIAHGETPDDVEFISWAINCQAVAEHEVREIVGAARAVVRDLPLAAEYEKRQKEATKAQAEFIRIRDERMAALKKAADARRLADNSRQAASEAVSRIAAIRNKFPELFDDKGQFRKPSK